MNNISKLDEFIIKQAIFKKLKEELEPNREGNLRDIIARQYRELYELSGSVRYQLRLGDFKVGEFRFNEVKAQPSMKATRVVVADRAAMTSWLLSQSKEQLVAWVGEYERIAEDWLGLTGELPDGVRVEIVETEGTPAGIKPGGVVDIRLDDFEQAIRDYQLAPAAARLLLGEAEEVEE